MKRKLSLIMMAILLALVFVTGCAKKTVLKEETATAKEATAAVKAVKPAEKAVVDEAKVAEKAAAVKKAEDAKKSAAAMEEAKAAAAAAVADRKSEEKGAAMPAKDLYELADIYFDYDKFSLRDEARATLNKHADWLNRNKDVMLAVEGHCDERGTAEYNLALGERRANAAAKFLIDNGVDARRIKTVSYGEELPLDPGHSEEAWAKNRRAHFVASGKK